MSLLIVLAVREGAIPGVNQDWLVRSIKRRDLLLAKVLIVVLLIHGPMVASNLAQGLAEGFSFFPTLRAALLSSFEVALAFSLPLMTIAALTKSMTEVLLGSLAIILGLILTYLLITHGLHLSHPVEGIGVAGLAVPEPFTAAVDDCSRFVIAVLSTQHPLFTRVVRGGIALAPCIRDPAMAFSEPGCGSRDVDQL